MEITKTDKNHFFISTKTINAALEHDNSKADVVLFSTPQESKTQSGDAVVFDSPGEYEVKNTMIDAISVAQDNTAYSVLSEGLRVAYIAGCDNVLSDAQVEAFAGVDILLVPVVADKADITTKIIGQIEPKVVVPHSYDATSLKLLTDEFGPQQEKVAKLKVIKKELVDNDQQRFVVLD